MMIPSSSELLLSPPFLKISSLSTLFKVTPTFLLNLLSSAGFFSINLKSSSSFMCIYVPLTFNHS